MKKFIAVLLLFLAVIGASAQDSTHVAKPNKKAGPTPEELQRKIDIKNEELKKKAERAALAAKNRADLDKKFANYSRDHIVLDLNAANWIYNTNDPAMNGMRTKWFSRGFNLAFNWDFRIKCSRVSIAPGIGYSNYTLYNRSKMLQDSSGIHYTPLPIYNGDTVSKINSLTLQYLEIPIELRIRSNPDRTGNCVKVVLGVKAGMRIDVHTRIKMVENGETQVFVVKRYSDFNLFRFGPTLRVGYSFFNVTAYYGVLGMFKPGLGPSAHEFSLGISFMAL